MENIKDSEKYTEFVNRHPYEDYIAELRKNRLHITKEYVKKEYLKKFKKKKTDIPLKKYKTTEGYKIKLNAERQNDIILAMIDSGTDEDEAYLHKMYEDFCIENFDKDSVDIINCHNDIEKYSAFVKRNFNKNSKQVYLDLENIVKDYAENLTVLNLENLSNSISLAPPLTMPLVISMEDISKQIEKKQIYEIVIENLVKAKRISPDEDIINIVFREKLGINSYAEYIVNYLNENYSEYEKDSVAKIENADRIRSVARIYSGMIFRNHKNLISTFIRILKNNKSVKALYKQYQEYELRSIMLLKDTIPEHMADMYPLARTMSRHFVLHVGPTNSGKTYQSIEKLKRVKKGVYLAPLRLLAYEIYDKLNEAGVPCDMLTGEEAIKVSGSNHVSCTIEMLDELEEYDMAVIDEGQNVGDVSRGGAWTKAILGTRANEIHICSDDSCVDLLIKMIEQCNDSYELITHERMTGLSLDRRFTRFPEDVRDRDALIVFSKKSVMAVASDLQKKGIAASILYGNLPYDVRLNEVRRFTEGETKVIVATDAIGMGVNLPIKRVVFLETKKFDGVSIRKLYPTEIKQIAGRAGRRGMYQTGYYTAEFGKHYVDEAIKQELPKVEKARVNFPDSIATIDRPLSELLRKWYDIPDEDIYVKSILEDDLILCKELENTIDDKQLIYKCITIAFDSRNKKLHEIFINLANAQNEEFDKCKESIRAIVENNSVIFEEDMDKMSLDELGELYSVYDLLYAFLRKFNHDEYLDVIMNLKRDCSNKMMMILQTEELVGRTCPECGASLKWNYPYRQCQRCFEKKYYP